MTLDSGNIRVMQMFAVVLKIYVPGKFSLDLRLPVSVYKERYGIPYSFSSSRL